MSNLQILTKPPRYPKKMKKSARNLFSKGVYLTLAATLFVGGFFVANSARAIPLPDVIINEFVSNPSSGNEWVELLNTTDSDVILSGWKLTQLTDPAVNPAEVDLLSLSGAIPANGILVFEVGAEKLNNLGDSIGLYDDTQAPIHRVSYGNVAAPYVADLAAPVSGESGSLSDVSWLVASSPTRGWFNGPPAPTINEIVSIMGNAGVTTNLGTSEIPNPSAATGLYFEKTGQGRVTFSAILNLTDTDTKDFLQQLGSKMDASPGVMKFDARLAAGLQAAGAQIKMYGLDGLGFTTAPNLIVKDDDGNIINPGDPNYPNLTDITYSAGTLTFNASHFTQFEADNNIYVSPDGNDTNGNGMQANPYLTIQKGVDSTPIGGTVHVAAGTYDETATPGITINKRLTISGAGASVTTVTGRNKNGSIVNGSDVLFNVTASDVTIENLTINLGDDDTDYDVGIFTPNNGGVDNLIFQNSALIFAAFGNGIGEQLIHLGGGSGATISGNILETASANSVIYVGDGSNTSLTITNNTVAPQSDADGGGTFFNQMGPVTNSTISGNNFTDTGIAIYLGAGASNTDTVTVSNNTFTGNNGHPAGYGALAITSEVDGVNTQNITVIGNTFIGSENQPAITIFDAANPDTPNVIGGTISITNNIFTDNSTGALNIGTGVSGIVSAVSNFWGSEDPDFMSIISGNANYTPWWVTSSGPDSTIPDVPVLIPILSPANNNQPTLTWEVVAASPPVLSYDIEIYDSNGDTIYAETTALENFTPDTPLGDDDYTWQVRARNSMGDSSYSDEGSFTIDTTPPDITPPLDITQEANGDN